MEQLVVGKPALRSIYENGTESDILLQTLRKSVMTDGYVVTESQEGIAEV